MDEVKLTKPQILLAEDEPNIAYSLNFILEKAGFDVETTADGLQVESKAHAMRPDLLILDIMLPNKSGFDVLGGIRANKTTKSLPVLMLSARGLESDVERARALMLEAKALAGTQWDTDSEQQLAEYQPGQ